MKDYIINEFVEAMANGDLLLPDAELIMERHTKAWQVEAVNEAFFLSFNNASVSKPNGILVEFWLHFHQLIAPDADANKKLPARANAPKELPARAKKAFRAAIEAGLMKKTADGYKWLYGDDRGKARLGYFIKQVFNPDGCESIPYKMLERLFGVTGLHTAQQQAMEAKKPQSWRGKIDAILL